MEEPLDTFSVRAYRPADHAALVVLWDRVFPDDPPRNAPAAMIERKLQTQPELLLVGEAGQTITGAVIAGFDGVRGWIYHLAVAPEFRRRGFATQLAFTPSPARRSRARGARAASG